MPQLGGHFWPAGERRENTGITFLVADTMPIALGCQEAVSNRRISTERAPGALLLINCIFNLNGIQRLRR